AISFSDFTYRFGVGDFINLIPESFLVSLYLKAEAVPDYAELVRKARFAVNFNKLNVDVRKAYTEPFKAKVRFGGFGVTGMLKPFLEKDFGNDDAVIKTLDEVKKVYDGKLKTFMTDVFPKLNDQNLKTYTLKQSTLHINLGGDPHWLSEANSVSNVGK